MDRFNGRTAVVTGASSGIGRAIAEDLVRAGMVVVGAARRVERVQELSARLEGLHAMQTDVSREEEVQRLYQWVEEHLGGVAVVVNCAAVAVHDPTQDLNTGTIPTMLNTNVGGVICSCKEAVNSMKRHGILDGHIININSVGGHSLPVIPGISFSVYAATKHAITAFCRGLRSDVNRMEGFKIRVSSISPGSVDTEMMQDPLWSDFVRNAPKDAMLSPKHVSEAVLYVLASPPEVEALGSRTDEPIGRKRVPPRPCSYWTQEDGDEAPSAELAALCDCGT